MYEVIKSVIIAGGYKLAEIQRKVKKLYLLGDITEEQMDELLSLAAGGVSTDAERPEVLDMIQTLATEIKALESRVKDLEGDEPAEPDVPAYPAWKPWDGISKDYQQGAIVSHNGQLWESVFNGQNVWEPGASGTDALWVIYTPEA
jgi:hypothetical protein